MPLLLLLLLMLRRRRRRMLLLLLLWRHTDSGARALSAGVVDVLVVLQCKTAGAVSD